MVNNFLSVVVAKIPFLSCYHIYQNLPILPQTKNPARYFPVIKNISNNFGHVKT